MVDVIILFRIIWKNGGVIAFTDVAGVCKGCWLYCIIRLKAAGIPRLIRLVKGWSLWPMSRCFAAVFNKI